MAVKLILLWPIRETLELRLYLYIFLFSKDNRCKNSSFLIYFVYVLD